ncbi:hypothetical protein MHU86_22446 [Fragilaria crotonensis]|nr:hypothetical protein MHU86_22446 [Fragilaria crotonensis]
MADKGIYTIITAAAMLIRFDATYGPRLINCWLPAETWVEALKKSGHIDATLNIDTQKFNAAFAKSASFGSVMSRFDGSNTTGVFHVRYRHQQFYYFTEETKQILYPSPLNRAWKERVLEVASNVLTIPSTRARPHSTSSSIDAENAGVINEDEQEVSPNKRRRVDGNNAGPSTFSYWPESPEAYLLFKPRREFVSVFDSAQNATTSTTMEYIETPQEALERRILQLKAVHESENSWRCVVQGGDPDNYCTKTEIYEIRQRSLFLILAYQLALQHMNKWTWHECCRDACKTLNGLGLNQATFYKTVAQWNMGFRELECFPHPNLYVQCGKRPLPRLLEIYPDAKEQILSFGMKT